MWSNAAQLFDFELTLRSSEYSKRFGIIVGQVFRQAIRAWLRTIITTTQGVLDSDFPVKTGTAKATLKPIGRLLRVAVPISPKIKAKGRGPGVGEAAASWDIVDTGLILTFDWTPGILWYYINEVRTKSKWHQPWNSMRRGGEAFTEWIDRELKRRMPNILDYLAFSERR